MAEVSVMTPSECSHAHDKSYDDRQKTTAVSITIEEIEKTQYGRQSLVPGNVIARSQHCSAPDVTRRTRPMRILNLGLFRTGTTSLRHALHMVGFEKVYHMDYVFSQKPSDSTFWLRAYEAKYRNQGKPLTRADWDDILGDCDAVSDFPCAAFSEELIAAYPEAKVILSVRDSTDAWYEGVMRTVWFVHTQSPFANGKPLGRPVFDPLLPNLFRMGKRMFGYFFDGDIPRTGKAIYESHNERIKQLVPGDRLLVFNVKQGWKPLCDFLGVEFTEEMKVQGFPHLNDGQAFVEKVLAKQALMRRKLKSLFGLILLGVASIVVLIRLLWLRS